MEARCLWLAGVNKEFYGAMASHFDVAPPWSKESDLLTVGPLTRQGRQLYKDFKEGHCLFIAA